MTKTIHKLVETYNQKDVSANIDRLPIKTLRNLLKCYRFYISCNSFPLEVIAKKMNCSERNARNYLHVCALVQAINETKKRGN